MSDDERIEQLELENKILQKNNKGLKAKIDEQSKEIEELKEKNKPEPDCAEPIERTEEMVNMKWVNHNYIRKDKIKAKIEEIKKSKENIYFEEHLESILQSLLEKE